MKKCAFCTKPADSREHIFSDWMLQMMPPNQRFTFNERVVERNEFVRYQGRKVKIKAKVVCTRCNNEWMNDLEGRLKTAMGHVLFSESPATLTTKDLTTISEFAFKTLILANHKSLTTVTPFFPYSVRRDFRLHLHIPDGIQVWMATRKTVAGKYYGFWKSVHGKTDKGFASYGFANYICNWNFQNIVLQVLATKWQDKTRRKTTPAIAFPQDDYWKQASELIWPSPPASLQWPPAFYLGDRTLIEYRDRWDTIKVSFS
jgi:hypothetical protein